MPDGAVPASNVKQAVPFFNVTISRRLFASPSVVSDSS